MKVLRQPTRREGPDRVGKCRQCGAVIRLTDSEFRRGRIREKGKGVVCPFAEEVEHQYHADVACHRVDSVYGTRILRELDAEGKKDL